MGMKKSKMKRKDALLLEIHALRKEMIRTGMAKGLNNKQTIELSQKLDVVLNKYQAI
jgi:hypothetical protein